MSKEFNLKSNFTYIVGRNGSGKTTFINNLIQSELKYTHSMAYLDQYAIKSIDRILINVLELLNTANFVKKIPDFEKKKLEILKYFNLLHLLNKKTSDLSGGEKQILLICLQLLKEVDVYILDEPFNNLDSNVIELLTKYLQKKSEVSKIVIISHHLDKIVKNATIFEVKNGDIFKAEVSCYY